MKLSAVLLVQNQILLNKYNYNSYRPIGTITETIDRLQELQVDEIVILNRGHSNSVVDDFFALFKDIKALKSISTPLAFGGGITELKQVEKLIDSGVERIVLSARNVSTSLASSVAEKFGEQSIIFHLPFLVKDKEVTFKCGNREHKSEQVTKALSENYGGEVILTSVAAEGSGEIDVEQIGNAIRLIPENLNVMYSGGVSTASQIESLASLKLNGVCLGNILNSKEIFIPIAKRSCSKITRTLNLESLDND